MTLVESGVMEREVDDQEKVGEVIAGAVERGVVDDVVVAAIDAGRREALLLLSRISRPTPLALVELLRPSTSRSKSLVAEEDPFAPDEDVTRRLSSLARDAAALPSSRAESSFSLRECSRSTLLENDLITPMYCSNCDKFSSGPSANVQRIGNTSSARNSVSTIWPTRRKTLSAAIITAGSLVRMALSSGTSFS